MRYQVFISHATGSERDRLLAHLICDRFESQGIRCWIAPRNVAFGDEFEEAIERAIESAQLMVLIWSNASNDSKWVKREVGYAADIGVTIIPVRTEPVVPGPGLKLYLRNLQWVEAGGAEDEKTLALLSNRTRELLSREVHIGPDSAVRLARELELLAEEDTVAREAFGRMEPDLRQHLTAYFRKSLSDDELIEDLIIRTMVHLWISRKTKIKDVGRLWAFLEKAGNKYLSQEAQNPTIQADPAELEQAEAPSFADTELGASIDSVRLKRAADMLWLGFDRASPLSKRQLKAARRFYVDGASGSDICKEFGISRVMADQWLNDRGVLNALAFDELYWSNDAVTAYLLSCKVDELDSICQEGAYGGPGVAPRGRWSGPQVWAIILRFRYGMVREQILRRTDVELTKEEFNKLMDSCLDQLPIRLQSTQLKKKLRSVVGRGGSQGLLRRLAFEYVSTDELPQLSILERVIGPATDLEQVITPAMISVWLSGGRIFAQLAKYFRTIDADEEEE